MWVFLAAYAGIFLKTAPVIFEWLFPHAVAVQAAASPLPVQKDIKSLTFVTYNVLDILSRWKSVCRCCLAFSAIPMPT